MSFHLDFFCRYGIFLLSRTDTLLEQPKYTVSFHLIFRRYDIFLFSRPDTLLAWASLPVVKLQQIRCAAAFCMH